MATATGPTADNIVLVAQVTTDGELSFSSTIAVNDGSGTQRTPAIAYPAPEPEGPTVTLDAQWIIDNAEEAAPVYAGWGDASLVPGANPDPVGNTSATVEVYTLGVADPYQGVAAPISPLNLISDGSVITLDVYAATAGDFLLKVEDAEAAAAPIEVVVNVPTPNVWTSLTVDLATGNSGWPDYIPAALSDGVYETLVLFADFAVANPGTWYVDNIQTAKSTSTALYKNDVVLINADAQDTDGTISQVEFDIDGSNNSVDVAAPYEAIWTAVAPFTANAVATDNDGLTGAASIAFSTVIDGNPIVIDSIQPQAGGDLNDVTLYAYAADADQGIASVVFNIDGQAIAGVANIVDGSGNGSYSATYSPTAGTKQFTVTATNGDSESATSAAVELIYANALPEITSLTPDAVAIITGTTQTFVAEASDADGSVASVAFSVNGSPLGTDTDGTDGWSIDYTASSLGAYTLEAVASDNVGGQSVAASVSFTVTIEAGDGYTIIMEEDLCSAPDIFCVPIIAQGEVNDVIGYDLELLYDNTLVSPTGIVIASEDMIGDRDWTSYNMNVINDERVMVSLFLNADAPDGTVFSGVQLDQLMCVEFARHWTGEGSADFTIDVISESYVAGVVDITDDVTGTYTTVSETEFNGVVTNWSDGQPLSTDVATEVQAGGVTVTTVDAEGNFLWNVANDGYQISFLREVDPAVSPMPVINGYDAYLTSLVAVRDASMLPNVYQMLAMDVNRDGRIAAGDITQISQRSVSILPEFATDWIFMSEAQKLTDPLCRISSTYPWDDGADADGQGYSRDVLPVINDVYTIVSHEYTDACADIDDEEFIAILLGDADGSYAGYAASVDPVELKAASTSQITFDLDAAVVSGGVAEIPVYVAYDQAINSVDFDIDFDAAVLVFKSISAIDDLTETVNASDDNLKVSSWSSNTISVDQVMIARFELAGDIDAVDFEFNLALLNGKEVDGIVVGSVKNSTPVNEISSVDAVIYPNPAANVINVEFDGVKDVAIFNLIGQVVELRKDVQGSTSINISHLPAGSYSVMVGLDVYNIVVVE
jgi:hypothetical protein